MRFNRWSNMRGRPIDPDEATLRRIGKTLERFDFFKVARVMDSLCWSWAPLRRPPNAIELQAAGRDLLVACYRNLTAGGGGCASGGGLDAECQGEADDPTFFLRFTLEESDSEYAD